MKRNILKRSWFLALSFGLILVDQWIKWAIVHIFHYEYQSVEVIKNVLRFTYLKNSGAAFSLMSGFPGLIAVLTGIMSLVCLAFLLSKKIKSPSKLFCISMLLAGGVGNLLDRIFRQGVVDYIDLQFWPLQHFAIFNFADCCVVIGAFGLFVCLLRSANNLSGKDG